MSVRIKYIDRPINGSLVWMSCIYISVPILFYIFVPAFVDNDSPYFLRFARLVEIKPFLVFPWLSECVHAETFPGHHFGYQLLLQLLSGFIPSDRLLYSVMVFIAFGLVLMAMRRVLKQLGTGYDIFWTLLLFSSSVAFLYRMCMLRPTGVSCALVLFYLWALVGGQRIAAFFICVIYVWVYRGFVLIPLFLLCWTFVHRYHTGRWDWNAWGPSWGGLTAGIVVNPFFPNNIHLLNGFLIEHAAADVETGLGMEWYPAHPAVWLVDAFPTILVLCVVFGLIYLKQPELSLHSIFFLTLFTLFSVLLIRSQRFIEYWPVFAILACASLIEDIADNKEQMWFMRKRVRIVLLATVTLLLPIQFYRMNLMHERLDMPYELFKNAGAWLKEHTEEREIVYNAGWSDFPQLFYWNPHNRYICGLDPLYMKMKDPERFTLYTSIEGGEINHPAAVIATRFNVRYAVAAKRPTQFYGLERFHKSMQGDPCARLVYEDAGTAIYEVSTTQLARAGGETGFSNR